MHADPRTPAVLLAVLYAVSGALCLLGAAWPMNARTPTGLLAATGAVGLVGSAALWIVAARVRMAVIHASVALAGGLLALLAWRSSTAVGIVGLGPALITLGLYAAHFFPL